jgi:hypothetical protein
LGSRSTGPLIGRFHNRPHRLNGFRVESKRSRGRSVLGGFWCKFRSAWVFCLARGFADFLRQVCHVKVKETAGWSGGRGFRRDRRTESRAPVLKHVRQAPVEHGHPNLDQQVGLPWLVLAQPRRIWGGVIYVMLSDDPGQNFPRLAILRDQSVDHGHARCLPAVRVQAPQEERSPPQR